MHVLLVYQTRWCHTLYCGRSKTIFKWGGMEIPCKLIFRGTVDKLQKVTKYFRDALEINVCIRKTNENSIVTPAHTVCKSVATMDASTAMNMAALTPPVKHPLDSSEEFPPEKHMNCIDISSSP